MNILDILIGTPWWVWVIFVYLIIVGVKSLKSHTMSLTKLAITPILLLFWVFYSFNFTYEHSFIIYGALIISLSIGGMLGRMIFGRYPITFNKKGEAYIPGSIYPLCLYMVLFIIKYCFGVIGAINPAMLTNITAQLINVIVSGIAIGIFAGRLAVILEWYYINQK
jgi:hypothetical protein